MSHNNLFSDLPDSTAVYQAMQRNMKRDLRLTAIFIGGASVCFVQALTSGAAEGWPWLIGGIASSVMGLIYFIDNSNRNFHLHTIDWIVATRESNTHKTD